MIVSKTSELLHPTPLVWGRAGQVGAWGNQNGIGDSCVVDFQTSGPLVSRSANVMVRSTSSFALLRD